MVVEIIAVMGRVLTLCVHRDIEDAKHPQRDKVLFWYEVETGFVRMTEDFFYGLLKSGPDDQRQIYLGGYNHNELRKFLKKLLLGSFKAGLKVALKIYREEGEAALLDAIEKLD